MATLNLSTIIMYDEILTEEMTQGFLQIFKALHMQSPELAFGDTVSKIQKLYKSAFKMELNIQLAKSKSEPVKQLSEDKVEYMKLLSEGKVEYLKELSQSKLQCEKVRGELRVANLTAKNSESRLRLMEKTIEHQRQELLQMKITAASRLGAQNCGELWQSVAKEADTLKNLPSPILVFGRTGRHGSVTSFGRQTYLPFAPEVCPMERLLGISNNSAVGEFKVFDIPSDMVAVGNRTSPLIKVVAVKCSRKRSNHIILSNEIHHLKAISSLGGHPNLPTILFYAPNETQFGMTPSGNPVNPAFLENQRKSPRVLSDILSAIIWLHDHNILHRDICWDNIVYGKCTHRPTLVDFGAAIHLPHEPVEVAYLGGFICCPPRLLADIPKPYIPEKSDDYHAYILLANSMLFPGSVAGFHCASVIDPDDDEVSRLQQLWCGLEESRIWDRYVKAAVEGNHAMMKTLPGVVFRLECQPKTVSADATLGFDELMVEQWATTYIPDTYEEDDSIPDTYDDDIPDAYEEQEYFDESE